MNKKERKKKKKKHKKIERKGSKCHQIQLSPIKKQEAIQLHQAYSFSFLFLIFQTKEVFFFFFPLPNDESKTQKIVRTLKQREGKLSEMHTLEPNNPKKGFNILYGCNVNNEVEPTVTFMGKQGKNITEIYTLWKVVSPP